MSIEKRLAAKKRVADAKRARVITAVVWTLVLALLCIGIGALIYKGVKDSNAKKAAEKAAAEQAAEFQAYLDAIDYEAQFTADGNVKDVKPSDYVTLADYKNTGIKLDDYQPSDDDVTAKIKTNVTSIEKKAKTDAGETVADDFTVDVDTVLTDAWVEKNAAETLGKDYEHTVAGYKEYVKKSLYDSNVSSLNSDIASFLLEKSTYKDLPEAFVNQCVANYRGEVVAVFNQYASLYAYYGWSTVYDQYESKEKFLSSTEESATKEAKTIITYLAIFDELGLEATEEKAEAYFKDQGSDYSTLKETYGQPYLFLQYKCSLVQDALKDMIK